MVRQTELPIGSFRTWYVLRNRSTRYIFFAFILAPFSHNDFFAFVVMISGRSGFCNLVCTRQEPGFSGTSIKNSFGGWNWKLQYDWNVSGQDWLEKETRKGGDQSVVVFDLVLETKSFILFLFFVHRISHIGKNTGSGHYVAHLKRDGKWVIFNDEKVALSESPPRLHAYLYLFQRSDTVGLPRPDYWTHPNIQLKNRSY